MENINNSQSNQQIQVSQSLSKVQNPSLIQEMKILKKSSTNLADYEYEAGNDQIEPKLVGSQSTAEAVGIVIYMSNAHYVGVSPDDYINFHFIHSKEVMFNAVFTYFAKKHNVPLSEIRNIVVGHEHGNTTKRCHMQCAVFFKSTFRGTIHPTTITIPWEGEPISYLMMGQRCKNKGALHNYCKKEHDFVLLNELAVDEKPRLDFQLESMCIQLYQSQGKKHDIINELKKLYPVVLLKNFTQVDRYLTHYHTPALPEFKWNIPEHILKSNVEAFQILVQHLKRWVFPENEPRRRALVLLSPKNMGKTTFINNLVPHPDYILYIRANMNADSFKNVATARLICLDDIGSFDRTQIEQFKGILSAQATGVRAAYLNIQIPSLPCVLLTNNESLCHYIFNAKEHYAGRYNIIELKKAEHYLGPPGTQRNEFTDIDLSQMYLSEEFLRNAKLKEMEYQLKLEQKKLPPVFNVYNPSIQSTMTNDLQIRKMKQQINALNSQLEDKQKEIQRLHKISSNKAHEENLSLLGQKLLDKQKQIDALIRESKNNINNDFVKLPKKNVFDMHLPLNEEEQRKLFPDFFEDC
jgi:hypothetical protein